MISLNRLSNQQKALIIKTVCKNPYIPHTPFRQQVYFLANNSEELLYGGQAGGGKSDALLMAALQYVTRDFMVEDDKGNLRNNYNALIIRRTLEDLDMPNAIMDRAKQWLLPLEDKGLVTWKEQKKRFIFDSGATLTFRYLNHNKHLNSYQGAELQFVGFDELTQFPENQYSYLHSRLRKLEYSPIPIRMRAGSNPGGRGHDWVKARFISPKSELPFISSAYTDNKYLNQEEYSKQLDKLDELTKQQLKYGNWDAVITSGLLMNRSQFMKSLISQDDFKDWTPVYCTIGIDPASTGTDKFAMSCLVYFDNGKLVLVDMDSTPSSNPEYRLRDFIIRNQQYKPRVLNFEREQGSAPHYALNYWQNLFLDLGAKMGFYVMDTTASSTGSKYNRAYPHAYHVRNGNMLINKDIPVLYDVSVDGSPYSPVRALQDQYIYVHPDKSVMENYSSPDELDSVSYAFEEMQKTVTGLSLTI